MKKLFKIILGATVGSTLLLSSCNFLDVDPYFEATFKEDSIFHSKKNAEGYLWNTPKGFPDAGAIWGNSWNPGESASDEITLKYQTNEFWGLQFSVGTINSRNLPIQNQWYDMYVIVARCNKMLKEVYNVPDMNEMDRRRYIGYVHFMRGYAYYHLLMNWGPLIIVGDEELSTSEPAEYYNRERATYDESVDYICDEFRLATQGIYSADEQSVNYYQRPHQRSSHGIHRPFAPLPGFTAFQWAELQPVNVSGPGNVKATEPTMSIKSMTRDAGPLQQLPPNS